MLTALILNTLFLLTPLERPELVIAQSKIESNHNINAKGKAGEKGAFQVIPKYWGKVPNNWKSQADQNEKIINELLESCKGDMKKAVTQYNGKGKEAKKYQQKVFKTAIRLHVLDVA